MGETASLLLADLKKKKNQSTSLRIGIFDKQKDLKRKVELCSVSVSPVLCSTLLCSAVLGEKFVSVTHFTIIISLGK